MSKFDYEISQLNDQIKELEKKKQIAEEKEVLLRMKALNDSIPYDVQRLVEHLHSVQCNSNHDDGCSWFYEFKSLDGVDIANWNGWAHKRYLEKAKKLISQFSSKIDTNTMIEIVSALK